jgi:methylated-DNA-[protein]-cysteine S-methyltransferase
MNSPLFKQEMNSPLGRLVIVANHNQLLGLWMEQQKYFGYGFNLESIANQENNITRATKTWLHSYFMGNQPQITSWNYRQIAQVLGNLNYARAVGQAIGHNPISIIIPCHRVLGSQGQLTGYAGGLERKQWLLHHEQGNSTKKS